MIDANPEATEHQTAAMSTVRADSLQDPRRLFLVADIGGTNARFAFAEPGNPMPQPIASYAVENFPSFDEVLDQLERDWVALGQPNTRLERVCLAVAAIPEQREISFTNNAWRFSADGVAARLSCPTSALSMTSLQLRGHSQPWRPSTLSRLAVVASRRGNRWSRLGPEQALVWHLWYLTLLGRRWFWRVRVGT
ncbi:MAG: hypothetical protein CM15mP74_31860 [Halieaceae bacterium]|nr:MAG: hypothetical protein CM15mP74_31860 [Halieaceae bacterium]